MLPRSKRVSTELFKDIIQKGAIFHGNLVVLRCQNSKEQSHFGISVPKKVAKTAVSRNKIKRRVYSIVKKMKSRLVSNKNSIIIMKSGSEKATFAELESEIEKIFVKSGLLK